MLKKLSRLFGQNSKIIFLILIGSLLWSLVMFRSGLKYDFGYGFWGPNGHDGVWHIALANNLSKFSFENPVFSGEYIKNYHLGFDLLMAVIGKLTGLRMVTLYFQILPPIFSILIGFLVYKFVLVWKKSKNDAFWAVFFTYFSGGFGFLVTFFKDRIISGESLFWSQQAFSTLVNPPFALSLILILSGMILLHNSKYLILASLCFGILLQIKAYAAILVLGGLFMAGLYEYYKKRKTYYIRVFLGSLVLNLILFFTTKNSGVSVFNFQPFWFLETMMSYSDRLGWEKFYMAMTTYRMGRVWFKAFLAYLTAFIIFIIGNMGMRVLGLDYVYATIKNKKLEEIDLFIFSVCLGAVFIPMLFVQVGTPWNTIQFFYYFLFFFGILAGISVGNFLQKYSALKSVAIITVSIFAVVNSWVTLQHYLPKFPQSKISNEEIQALDFLKNEQKGIVLTYPFNLYKAREAVAPRPLYFYDSTAYVSAFSNNQTFLEDEVNLNIMGFDFKNRREQVLEFVSNLDPGKGKQFLKDNNIIYLYLVKENSPIVGQYLKLGEEDLNLKKIFENSEVLIYLVD